MTVLAVVINIHYHGATVRLPDGTLASVPSEEFAANRPRYEAGFQKKTGLELVLSRKGRYASVSFPGGETAASPSAAPPEPPCLIDPVFEERIGDYLRATEEWAPSDRPAPAERHFIRKKRRAAFFEARNKPT